MRGWKASLSDSFIMWLAIDRTYVTWNASCRRARIQRCPALIEAVAHCGKGRFPFLQRHKSHKGLSLLCQLRQWLNEAVWGALCCRLKAFGSKTDDDVKAAMKGIPEGLMWAFNLGHADVFPATSGKENAAKYLMDKFDAAPTSSFLLCDDDNDIGAALLSSDSSLQYRHWTVPPGSSTLSCPSHAL